MDNTFLPKKKSEKKETDFFMDSLILYILHIWPGGVAFLMFSY